MSIHEMSIHEQARHLLYVLCKHDFDIGMFCYLPLPATHLSGVTGVTAHQVRYRLKKLKDEGLIDKACEIPTIAGERQPPVHGWRITEKARTTPEYAKAKSVMEKTISDYFKD